MSGDFLLGIDVGTSASKGVIVDLDGTVVAEHTVSHGVSMPRPGWAEHDADAVWWRDFCAVSQALLAQSGLQGEDIAAIGCSAIAPCVLPVDAAGRPMRPAILYGIDTRSARQIQDLERELGPDRILQTGGCALSTQSVGPKIRWLHDEEPETYARADKFLTSTSYLVYRLTGEAPVDYYTGLAYGPLFNVHELDWDAEMCPAVVEPERLPRLGWTTEIAGSVRREAAAETGLAPGTPVIIGTADASAEAVSVGVVAPGQMMIMYGSTMFFLQVRPSLTVDRRLWAGVYLFERTYALAAGMATSGSVTRWFRDELAAGEVAIERETGASAYELLARAAAEIAPGAEGLIVLPYFAGERTPLDDPLARGVIAGLTLAHTRAHVYRAVLEGTAFGVRHNLETMAGLGDAPTELTAVGGGTRNHLWLQIVSDVVGLPQCIPAQALGAAYGDAFLAGHGAGLFKDYRAIGDWVKVIDTVEPSIATNARYEGIYPLYRALYEDSRETVHALARLGAAWKE